MKKHFNFNTNYLYLLTNLPYLDYGTILGSLWNYNAGICCGLSTTLALSFLTESGLNKATERFQYIEEKLKTDESALSIIKEQELPAFLEAITIAQHPLYLTEKFTGFPDLDTKDTQKVLNLIAPTELPQGVRLIDTGVGIFTESTLKQYLNDLVSSIEHPKISFLIKNSSHMIMCGFEKATDQWTLLDIQPKIEYGRRQEGFIETQIDSGYLSKLILKGLKEPLLDETFLSIKMVLSCENDKKFKINQLRLQDLINQNTRIIAPGLRDNFSGSQLHLAAIEGNLERLKLLWSMTHEPNVTRYDGHTPLSVSVNRNDLEMATFLCESGAEISQKHKTGLISIACISGNIEMIKLLLSHGAIIEQTDRLSLILAARLGTPELLQFLLDQGLDINGFTPSTKESPIYIAVQYGNLEGARFLLNHGAKVDQEYPKEIKTLFDIAAKNGDIPMIKLLLEKNVPAGGLENAIILGSTTIIELLLPIISEDERRKAFLKASELGDEKVLGLFKTTSPRPRP